MLNLIISLILPFPNSIDFTIALCYIYHGLKCSVISHRQMINTDWYTPLQSLVNFHEEGEILVGHIRVCVTPVLAVLLLSVSPTTESILCDLVTKKCCERLVSNDYSVFTLCLICSGVSVRKIEEVGSPALILDCGPCSAGKKVECSSAGLRKPSRRATSRVIRK